MNVSKDENPEWVLQSIARLYELDYDDYDDTIEIGEKFIPEIFEGKVEGFHWSPGYWSSSIMVNEKIR